MVFLVQKMPFGLGPFDGDLHPEWSVYVMAPSAEDVRESLLRAGVHFVEVSAVSPLPLDRFETFLQRKK